MSNTAFSQNDANKPIDINAALARGRALRSQAVWDFIAIVQRALTKPATKPAKRVDAAT